MDLEIEINENGKTDISKNSVNILKGCKTSKIRCSLTELVKIYVM